MRFFLRGLRLGVSPQRHGGTNKHEGFAAEKRGKGGGAEMILCGEVLLRVIATKALRRKETRRFLPRRKEEKELAQR